MSKCCITVNKIILYDYIENGGYSQKEMIVMEHQTLLAFSNKIDNSKEEIYKQE